MEKIHKLQTLNNGYLLLTELRFINFFTFVCIFLYFQSFQKCTLLKIRTMNIMILSKCWILEPMVTALETLFSCTQIYILILIVYIWIIWFTD